MPIDDRFKIESGTPGCAYVKNEYVPLASASVAILDRGFVRSDATYDVVHIWKGRFFRLNDHIARFYRSMAGLRMSIQETPDDLSAIIKECSRRSGLQDGYIQMTCTRGVPPAGSRDPRMCENRLTVFIQPFVWILKPEHQDNGLKMIVSKTLRIPSESVDQRIKNFNWLDLTRGIFEAYDQDADVAVHPGMHGGLTEGAGFNIFAVKGSVLATPEAGIFEGITRGTILEIAPQHQLTTCVGTVTADALADAEEIFVTSTAGGVMPVTRLHGSPVGNGRPGPVTVALRSAYWDLHQHPRYSTDL